MIHDCFWDIFGNYETFTQFQFKIRALSCEKVVNLVLLDNCFNVIFTKVEIWYRRTFKFGPGRFLESKSQPKYDCF